MRSGSGLELVLLAVRRVGEPGEIGDVGEVPSEVLAPFAEARLADAKAHRRQTFSERLPFAPGGVAEVDDELGVLDELLVVDGRVVGDDHDAVVLGRLERDGLHREAVLGELGHVRIVVGDVCARVLEQADDLHRRRLAHVRDVGLVGDAEDEDPRALERALPACG